jgi:Tat protein translocase TatB subunit
MFGLSFTHLLILAVIVLVFIGPEQLPQVARMVAQLLNEWKRTTSELQSSLTNHLKTDIKREEPAPPELPPAPPGDTVKTPPVGGSET